MGPVIHHLNCGTMCPRLGPRLGLVDREPGHLVARCLLIEDSSGLILLDTGFGAKDIATPSRLGPARFVIEPRLDPTETALTQVKAVGHDPADVRHILVTHLDLDHAGGLTHFPKAKFLAGKNEIRYAYWPEAEKRWAFILNDYIPTRGYDWLELDRDFDMFGDGSLQFLLTPGHTPGECSLLVNLPSRKILLTGDTVHVREAVGPEATMPLDTDPIQSVISIKRIKAIRDMYDATMWITHDPRDWKEYPHKVE